MSKSRTPKPSYVLTTTGQNKLRNKCKDSTDTYLADLAGMDRGTIAKIRNGSTGVNFSTLESLFGKLEIVLDDGDYQEFNRSSTPSRRKSSQTSPNKDDIPKETETEKLKNALRELNYHSQDTLFTESVGVVEPAGAFLIHGKSGYGQRWLVNRLSYKVPHFTDAFYCSLCLSRHRNDIQKLWENLAPKVGSHSASPQDIVEAIYQHWQTQTVMLCFRNVDLVGGTYLNQLFSELWLRLVNKIHNANSQALEHPILLFLIDNYGKQKKLGISFVSQLDFNQPHIPVELEELELFEKKEIKRWVGTKNQLFSPQLTDSVKISDIIDDITGRNSTPENALKAICSWCNLDWYEDIERGLKL